MINRKHKCELVSLKLILAILPLNRREPAKHPLFRLNNRDRVFLAITLPVKICCAIAIFGAPVLQSQV